MNKTYLKDGNSNRKGKKYCKEHFIKKHGREPNILDTVHFGTCPICVGEEVIK